MKSRRRTFHRGATGTAMAICTTTQIPPPQNPVPPPTPVSVYLHRNVQKSMEMNQTVQAVSVVLKDVLLLVRIATQMVIYAVILLLQCAVNKMVLHPIVLPVGAVQQIVLLNLIALNLPIYVHHVLLQPVLIQMD